MAFGYKTQPGLYSSRTSCPSYVKMNYIKIFVALLASTSFVSAAAHPEAGVNGICTVDFETLNRLIPEGDRPDEMVAAFGGCWAFTMQFMDVFQQMITHGRLESLQACLPQINFPNDDQRGTVLTALLYRAIQSGNMQIADFLLTLGFDIQHTELWDRLPWNREDTLQFLRRHPGHADGLAPKDSDISHVRNEEDGLTLVEMARCCEELQPGTVDPTPWLFQLLNSNLNDAEMAAVAGGILRLGALVEENVLEYVDAHFAGFPQTTQLIHQHHEAQNEEIKDPGFE